MCKDGDGKDAGDGCNKCVCTNGNWACTQMPCPDPGEGCSDAQPCPTGFVCNEVNECVPEDVGKCVVSGCSGEICAPTAMTSNCLWLPEYQCLIHSKCGQYGEGGSCAWSQTDAYLDCLDNLEKPGCESNADCGENEECVVPLCLVPPCDGMFGICKPKVNDPKECYEGGCFDEICSDQKDVKSSCEWNPAFKCYEKADCEQQESGECGWTPALKVEKCLENLEKMN